MIDSYRPIGATETADVERTRELIKRAEDPWARENPLHLTASAVIVHPPTKRVLLRWHPRMQLWLQVGGHGDPGERDPVEIALREAREETALPLEAVGGLVHVVIVPVPAAGAEPAHEHADLRFVLTTDDPDAARPETPEAPLRWVTFSEAYELIGKDVLRETLERVEQTVNTLLWSGAPNHRPLHR